MIARWLMAAVVLGGSFGSASATVSSIEGEVMTIDIQVEVGVSAQAVVAHLSFDTDPTLTLPLLDRGGGVFGIHTQLEPKNYFVVFEILGPAAESSEPLSIAELGAELGSPGSATTTTVPEDDELSDESRRSLWLAVALGAASLSFLAFWVLGERSKAEEDGGEAPTG